MQRRHAFTLIELLVVIAIVGVLVATLMPAIGLARESARKLKCAANFRGIMLAQLTYGTDNRYFPVMPGDLAGGTGWQAFNPANALYLIFARNYLDPSIDVSPPNSPIFCPANPSRSHTLGGGVHYMSALGSSPGLPSPGYLDTPIWMKIDKADIVPGGGAMCYDSVCWRGGWQFIINNHGFMPDGTTKGGNVAFRDGHVLWEDETHWSLRYGYEGTTYPNDHPVVRVWGTVDKFGYGPANAALWGGASFLPFFN